LRAKLPAFEFASQQRMGADLRLILTPKSVDSAAPIVEGS